MILSLEATSLTLALLYSLSFSSFSEDYIGIILLTFAAAETAAALALLATLTRLLGSDIISSCSFSSSIVRQKLDIIDGDKNGFISHYFIPE